MPILTYRKIELGGYSFRTAPQRYSLTDRLEIQNARPRRH